LGVRFKKLEANSKGGAFMSAGKAYVNASSPDAWGETLPHGEIWFDPVHAELIGEDIDSYYAKLEAMNISGEVPNIDPAMWVNPEPYRQWKELVGEEEEEEEEEEREEEEEEGEDSEDTSVDMGPPESDEPGASGPPSFDAGPLPGVTNPVGPAAAAMASPAVLRRFQANIKARNPTALKALLTLQHRAKSSPKAAKVYKKVAAPWIPKRKVKGKASIRVHGEVIGANPVVSRALGQLVTTLLSPVAWGVHGVGTMSHEVANTLSKLAGKI
jgi:hypothetical protein